MIKTNSNTLLVILVIVFTSVFGLGAYLLNDHPISLQFGILTGFLSAIGFWLVLEHYSKLYGDDSKYKTPVTRQTKMILNTSFDEAFELCLISIKSVRRSRILSSDVNKGTIIVSVGAGFHSFGEVIHFFLSKTMDDGVEVIIISQSRVQSTALDLGKNLDNLNRIEKVLMAKCKPVCSESGTSFNQNDEPPPINIKPNHENTGIIMLLNMLASLSFVPLFGLLFWYADLSPIAGILCGLGVSGILYATLETRRVRYRANLPQENPVLVFKPFSIAFLCTLLFVIVSYVLKNHYLHEIAEALSTILAISICLYSGYYYTELEKKTRQYISDNAQQEDTQNQNAEPPAT